MKAYKEWVMGPASKDWIRDEFTGAEAAWRAALEWIREEEDLGRSPSIKDELGE